MTASRSFRRTAASSSLAIAIALVVGKGPEARAQSFDASGTVVAGSASISTGSGTTDVFVSGNAVINWVPTDTGGGTTPIIFQPSGTTATFSSSTEFTVLNRILPTTATRSVRFDGTVLGRVGASAPVPGGTVYFYSPGGIIASGSSVFDVGNLGLTTSPVAYDPTSGVFDAGDTVSFGAANAGSSVTIQSGASLSGTGYLAIVSPVITNAGSIQTTATNASAGAVAMVAANAADITFSPDGLFNITVTQGTAASGTVLSNSGSAGGPNAGSIPAGSAHKVYMVAVPQNQAITMTIASGSNLGFNIANAAQVAGNTVILSGGYDVVAGDVANRSGGTGSTSLIIGNGGVDVTSALVGQTTGAINVTATAGTLNFASDLRLTSPTATILTVDGVNSSINVGRDLFASAEATGTGGLAMASIDNGGSLNTGRDAFIISQGYGIDSNTAGVSAGDGVGGTATLQVHNSASVNASRGLYVFADGIGGAGRVAGAGAGAGRAGTANLIIDSGASVNVGVNLEFTAEGFGGLGGGCLSCLTDGGNAVGGTANFNVLNASITTGGLLRTSVRAIGGDGQGAAGGSATGGTVNGVFTGGTLTAGTTVLVDANGTAGNHASGGVGGNGTGGVIGWVDGTLSGAQVTVNAIGQGGDSLSAGGVGGAGTGGTTSFVLNDATTGTIDVNSGGFGGSGDATGGSGSGGTAILAISGTSSASGLLSVFAHGAGGNAAVGAGSGGQAAGGTAQIAVNSGGTLDATQGVTVDASAFGGASDLAAGQGGSALAGAANLSASAGTITISGGVQIASSGLGGAGLNGGNGQGNSAVLQAFNGGSLSIDPAGQPVEISADGIAGDAGSAGGVAGNSRGGNAQIVATVNGTIDIANTTVGIYSRALRSADSALGTDGGDGTGGSASISQNSGGTVSITAPVVIDAHGEGGHNYGGGDRIGGTGTGGDVRIAVNGAGGIAIDGTVSLIADGFGGDGLADSGISSGGAGTGGITNIGSAIGPNSVTGTATLSSIGVGGRASLDGNGGAGTGGQAVIGVIPAAASGTITLQSNAATNASGLGGDGAGTGSGGNGTGGTAQVFATGGDVGIAGLLDMNAEGQGGAGAAGASGNGRGGIGSILADGFDITFGSNIRVSTDGHGLGNNETGNGGSGTGGTSSVIARNGSQISVAGNTTLLAGGFGSYATASTATGGNGIGGTSIIRVRSGGTISLGGLTVVDAIASGGEEGPSSSGIAVGGAATGGQAFVSAGLDPVADAGGGSITVDGNLEVVTQATGGSGRTGGAATGGISAVVAWNGAVTVNPGFSTNLSANAFGGGAINGGTGGNATGGRTDIHAGNSLNGGSTITLNAVSLDVVGLGGDGGAGVTGNGGNGGSGTGGEMIVTAGAGNGTLTTGAVSAFAGGTGGVGGAGVAAGSGGNGGAGTGGYIQIGSESASDTPTNTGSATYASINLDVQAFGGTGGDAPGTGSGGNGGAAQGGAAVLLVRGSPVTVTGDVNMIADARGGNGGIGSVQGLGGNATIGGAGGIGVTVTNRFNQPTQRGTLTAGTVFGTTSATGGTGSTNGLSIVDSAPLAVTVTNSDISVASLQLFAAGTSFAPNMLPSTFTVEGGDVGVSGRLIFDTDGDLTLTIDNSSGTGSVTADQIDIFAHNWVLGTAPTSIGLLNGISSIDLGSQNDLAAQAQLLTSGDLGLFASGGQIVFGDVSTGGNLLAQAAGPITLGNVSAIGHIDLLSGGSITTLDASAGNYLNYEALGSVTAGNLSSGEYTEIDSLGGAALVGDVTVGDYFTLQANGNATVGDISAGIFNASLDPLATYNVGVAALGNTTVGNVSAAGDIGLLAVDTTSLGIPGGGNVTTGSLSGRDILVLADNAVTINGLVSAAARFQIADASLASLGGAFETFDKEPVFAATPVAIAGPIVINGSVNAGSFIKLYTASSITATSGITAGTSASSVIQLNAGGNISVTGATSGAGVFITSAGTGTFNDITARGALFAGANNGLTIGNISAADRVLLGSSGGNVTVGNVVSDPAPLGLPGSLANTIHIGAAGNVTTGNLRSIQSVALVAGQNITTAQITSRFSQLLLAGNSVTAGVLIAGPVFGSPTNPNLITGANGNILIGNASMLAAGGNLNTLDYNAVFATTPVRAGGSVQISQQVIAGFFESYSAGGITGRGIAGFSEIQIETGGTATITGVWSSPSVELQANDIDIALGDGTPTNQGGSLRGIAPGLVPGEVTLVSENSAGALIGDGLSGSGFALSNAELNKISAGTVLIGSIDNPANEIDMRIGDLTVTAKETITTSTVPTPTGAQVVVVNAGVINGADGRIQFVTGVPDPAGGDPTISGGIRVEGNLSGADFLSTNAVEFYTGVFELNAATGSVKLADNADNLSGILQIQADHIHIADADLLAKLRDDPFYEGRIADLNAPATVQRPDGVIAAGGLDLFPGATLYIQNTGTSALPAGFLTVADNSDITPPDTPPSGGVEVVINGAFQTDTGVVSGRAAYELLASDPDLDPTGFSTLAQLNSCLLVGGCPSENNEPPIADEIDMIGQNPIGDDPAVADDPDEEEKTEEEKAAEAATEGAPIAPPAPLIDTRPLNPPATITEPITGSGNPALIGSAVNEATASGDNQ